MLDKNLIESVIFCIILFIVLYFSITYYNNRNHTYVKADDGNEYRVQIAEDNKESANLLSDAITRVKTLLDHLKKSESQDIRTKTLLSRFNPDNITENDPQEMKSGVTSYTVNKGEKIVVCLRQRNNNFVEINMLLFTNLHIFAI
jgi:hypothetical protein